MKMLSSLITTIFATLLVMSVPMICHAATSNQPTTIQIDVSSPAPKASKSNKATQQKPSANEEAVDPKRKLVARVVWVKGTFTATAPGSDTKRVLKTASNIYMNDTLLTDAASEAQIVFTDNSTMAFREGTKLYINDYNYAPKKQKDPESKSVGTYIVDLITGGFRTITGLVAKENPDDYKVNTPVATIGVRGTEFSVYYKDGKTFLKRYKGEPCISEGGQDKEMTNEQKKLCLDEKNKYAQASQGQEPEYVVAQPDVFEVDVEVVPVTFTDLINGGSGSSSGFCIQ